MRIINELNKISSKLLGESHSNSGGYHVEPADQPGLAPPPPSGSVSVDQPSGPALYPPPPPLQHSFSYPPPSAGYYAPSPIPPPPIPPHNSHTLHAQVRFEPHPPQHQGTWPPSASASTYGAPGTSDGSLFGSSPISQSSSMSLPYSPSQQFNAAAPGLFVPGGAGGQGMSSPPLLHTSPPLSYTSPPQIYSSPPPHAFSSPPPQIFTSAPSQTYNNSLPINTSPPHTFSAPGTSSSSSSSSNSQPQADAAGSAAPPSPLPPPVDATNWIDSLHDLLPTTLHAAIDYVHSAHPRPDTIWLYFIDLGAGVYFADAVYGIDGNAFMKDDLAWAGVQPDPQAGNALYRVLAGEWVTKVCMRSKVEDVHPARVVVRYNVADESFGSTMCYEVDRVKHPNLAPGAVLKEWVARLKATGDDSATFYPAV